MAQKPWIVLIPGSTQMPHMLENIAANDVKFTADELKEFNAELGNIKIEAARLPESVQVYSSVEVTPKKSQGFIYIALKC